MNQNEWAEKLATYGFWVFPLKPNTKLPAHNGWQDEATRDPEIIKSWFIKNPNYNYGIFTSKFNESEALLVIDVDNKEDKMGEDELFRLENVEGYDFPLSCEQDTPTGGRHIIYKIDKAIKQSTSKIGRGIDTRSKGGYIVASGSIINKREYKLRYREVVSAPEKLVKFFTKSDKGQPERIIKQQPGEDNKITIDADFAISRAIEFIESAQCPKCTVGSRNANAYIAATRIKDFGVSEQKTFELLRDGWADAGFDEELRTVVGSAFKYGENSAGSDAPEARFNRVKIDNGESADEDLGPILNLNKEYAFTIIGGKSTILHESIDSKGEKTTNFLNFEAFKHKIASKTIGEGKAVQKIADLWMSHPHRRSYEGLYFYPAFTENDRFYNLWKGFSVKPAINDGAAASAQAIEAFNNFLTHLKTNICGGNLDHYTWILNYCAHIIQKPEVKPMIAIVFRGEKGVGKNFFVEQIGSLFRNNYMVTADDRYIVGNFNSHLEQCLLLVLDEAFWSGNKKADGMIKSLITERHHVIERKGKDAYVANSYSRICILGNSDWLVPASNDERRFAVFDVGSGRKQDTAYFGQMVKGMNEGGRELLMAHLSSWPVDEAMITQAPQTKALQEQKESSLHLVHQWWFECLQDGRLIGHDIEFWPETIATEAFWDCFLNYAKKYDSKVWNSGKNNLVRTLKKCMGYDEFKVTVQKGENRAFRIYKLPNLTDCRANWDKWQNSSYVW